MVAATTCAASVLVGAAAGCDLLLVKNKDRSLRQLLQPLFVEVKHTSAKPLNLTFVPEQQRIAALARLVATLSITLKVEMSVKGKFQIWIWVLIAASITLGASLNARGLVGFWGMFAIMMAPNALLFWFRRRPVSKP
ncbi:hypothetical protein SB766_13310 [Pseudomonas sp. SIMBA_077]